MIGDGSLRTGSCLAAQIKCAVSPVEVGVLTAISAVIVLPSLPSTSRQSGGGEQFLASRADAMRVDPATAPHRRRPRVATATMRQQVEIFTATVFFVPLTFGATIGPFA